MNIDDFVLPNSAENPFEEIIDVSIFKEEITQHLINVFEKVIINYIYLFLINQIKLEKKGNEKKKIIIMNQNLIKKMNFFLTPSILDKYGFERKVYIFENCPYNTDATRIVYIIPRTRQYFPIINKQYDCMYNLI